MVYEEEETPYSVQTVGDIIGAIKAPISQGKRPPNSEIAATVTEIEKIIPLTKRYGFGFWLKLVKNSGVSYTEMLGILKEISRVGLNKQGEPYNKAGILVNKLKKLCLNKQSIISYQSASQKTKLEPSGKKNRSKDSSLKMARLFE